VRLALGAHPTDGGSRQKGGYFTQADRALQMGCQASILANCGSDFGFRDVGEQRGSPQFGQ